ncbi:hypothetical protein ACP4OV_002114 [Aristida adscensionis]
MANHRCFTRNIYTCCYPTSDLFVEIKPLYLASSVVKIGPWGRKGYRPVESFDIAVAPLRLESITVYHGDVVDGLAFSYRDREKQPHTAGPWGGTGGQVTTIELRASEFVTEVHGKHGSYYGHDGIASLTLVTNLQTHGPFGGCSTSGWERFSVPVKNNASIVGFFVHTGNSYLSAIGVYVKPF